MDRAINSMGPPTHLSLAWPGSKVCVWGTQADATDSSSFSRKSSIWGGIGGLDHGSHHFNLSFRGAFVKLSAAVMVENEDGSSLSSSFLV